MTTFESDQTSIIACLYDNTFHTLLADGWATHWKTMSSNGSAQLNKQVFTSNGIFTTPPGTTINTVYKFIATGGGGGACYSNNQTDGKGGGAGATAIKWVSGISAGTNIAITIGSGGLGAHHSLGAAAGGTTSVGSPVSIAAGGGAAGTKHHGGPGGTAAGGDMNLGGEPGNESLGGESNGGSSIWGGGGSVVGTTTDATAYGGGGAGGSGDGYAGVVTVEWIQ